MLALVLRIRCCSLKCPILSEVVSQFEGEVAYCFENVPVVALPLLVVAPNSMTVRWAVAPMTNPMPGLQANPEEPSWAKRCCFVVPTIEAMASIGATRIPFAWCASFASNGRGGHDERIHVCKRQHLGPW